MKAAPKEAVVRNEECAVRMMMRADIFPGILGIRRMRPYPQDMNVYWCDVYCCGGVDAQNICAQQIPIIFQSVSLQKNS